MKVLQNRFNREESDEKLTRPKVVRTFCDHCDSELEVSEGDIHFGWLGAAYVECPCCGMETMVEEMDGIELTKDNVEFPIHFHRINRDLPDVKDITNEKISLHVKDGIEWFRRNKKEPYWYTSSGNLFFIMFRYEDDEEYHIVVTKDFYETDIPFEGEDY